MMITKEIITKSVCEILGVKEEDLMKPSGYEDAKKDKVRYARQLCMTLCRKYNLGTQKEIGEYYGGRDHATCFHSERVTYEEMEIYPEKKVIFSQVELKIYEMVQKNMKELLENKMQKELDKFIQNAKNISSEIINKII